MNKIFPARDNNVLEEPVARPHKEEFRSALREQSEMKFLRATAKQVLRRTDGHG